MLDFLARACAVLAGVLLSLMTLMMCTSILGRNLAGVTLVGDFELTAVATGLSMALFMPWCQLHQGHIIVDFFTARAQPGTQHAMDRNGALLVAICMTVLAWRTAVGGLNAWDTQSGSMLLAFPDWVVYAGMAPPLLLTACIALVQAFRLAAVHETENTP